MGAEAILFDNIIEMYSIGVFFFSKYLLLITVA